MCTKFNIISTDKNVLVARTMDFAKPTGTNFKEFKTSGKISFKAKYSQINFVDNLSLNVICDGLNEKGLSLEVLWLPRPYTTYDINANLENFKKTIFLPQAILESCATLADVKNLLQNFKASVPLGIIEKLATIHFSITDLSGQSIVIEFEESNGQKGVPIISDNSTSVLTNAPNFSWHLTNLNNWISINEYNVLTSNINGFQGKTTGYGNNLLGLPADYTPPSRFILVNILLNLALKHEVPENFSKAMLLADKIISKVVVILGTSANQKNASCEYDYTQWIVLKDLKNYEYYQKSVDSLEYIKLV